MSIIVKSKARVFGECLTTVELLQALKHKVFTNANAPVQLFTQYNTDFLKVVYLCPNCSTLHFCTGDFKDGLFQQKLKHIQIYIDHSNDGNVVTRKELIELLSHLNEVRKISLEHVQELKSFALTEVIKCDSCDGVHLDCAYAEDCLRLN